RLARPADAGEAARGPPRPAAAALATARHRGRRALGRKPHRDGRYWRGTTRFGGLRPNGEKAGAGRGRSGCTHFVAALWRRLLAPARTRGGLAAALARVVARVASARGPRRDSGRPFHRRPVRRTVCAR